MSTAETVHVVDDDEAIRDSLRVLLVSVITLFDGKWIA